MKRIKILYTIPNFDTAGSGKVLYDLANRLDKNIFEVEIACNNSNGDFFKEVEKLNLPIHIFETTTPLRPYYSLFFRILSISRFIKKNQIDILHSWHWSSDWTEIVATRFAGKKFVYTKKAMSWGNIHWKIKSYLSNFIVTINNEMTNYFPNKKNQKLIPLGIDTEYYNPDLFTKQNTSSVFKIVTIANLVPVKGIEVLIKAVAELKNKNIKLDIIGDTRDPYSDYLRKLIFTLKVEDQVSFLGKFTDIRPFLVNSDLYVIPTLNSGRKEGMPMALVEAMTMMVPVLGSNITGINYVLNDFKEYLFEANNHLQLANKIDEMILKNELERKEIGMKLRGYCETNFSLQKFIKEHENLYKSITRI